MFGVRSLYFFLCLLALSLQVPVLGFEVSAGGLKYSHFFSIGFILFAFKGFLRLVQLKSYATVIFFFYLFVLSYFSGSNISSLGSLFFALYAYLLGYGLAFNGLGCYRAIKVVAVIVLILVSVKNLFFLNEFITSGFYGAQVPTLYSGGGNIEATWLMLLTIFFGSRFLFTLFAISVSLLYGSRAGFVAFLMVYIFSSLIDSGRISWGKILYLFFLLFFLWLLQYLFFNNILFERVLQLSNEADLQIGRIFLWINAIDLIGGNYLGYGSGLGIEAARFQSGVDFRENNFHNIFLQVLVDAGFVGFLYYIFLLSKIIVSRPHFKNDKSLKFFLLSYVGLGFLQFTSLEMYFWFFYGVYDYKMKRYE